MANSITTMNINGYETLVFPRKATVFKRLSIAGVDLTVTCDFRYENEKEFDAKFTLAVAAIENTDKVDSASKLVKKIVSVEKL